MLQQVDLTEEIEGSNDFAVSQDYTNLEGCEQDRAVFPIQLILNEEISIVVQCDEEMTLDDLMQKLVDLIFKDEANFAKFSRDMSISLSTQHETDNSLKLNLKEVLLEQLCIQKQLQELQMPSLSLSFEKTQQRVFGRH